MKILLAGNRGYLGAVLEHLLLRDGHDVVGLDTGFYDAEPVQPRRDIRHVTLKELTGCEAVVNLAAMCNDACGSLSANVTHQINTDAALRLARMAKSQGVRAYVFASSCSVYGAASGGELTETDAVAPETAYATSKVIAERELRQLADGGFGPIALRFATLFGDSPSFRSDILVNRVALTACRWGKISMNGEGLLWRPLLHVRDAARAIRAVLYADAVELGGEVFNVGFSDQNHRIADVVAMACEMLPGVTVTKSPAPDNRTYAVCFDNFHATFDQFRSSCSVSEGLREVIEAYQRRLRLPLSAAGDGWANTDRCERLLAMRSASYLGPDFRWNKPSLVVA